MKKRYLFFIDFLTLCLFCLMNNGVLGCTAFMLKTNEGVVTGRTMDYSQPSVYDTMTYRVGTVIQSVYDPGSTGNVASWIVKYNFITINNVLSDPVGYYVAFEGMNKAGISISGNLANAEYPDNDPDKITLSSDDIVRYILSLAGDIADVKSLFSSINIVSTWKYHYIVFDSSGNSLVTEFTNGEPKFYENVTPILTNNPNMDYNLANLNNFANLKNYNAQSIIPESGNQFHGAGMFGLPGDWMSPSRFVRGYFMINDGLGYVSTSQDAINLSAKIINSVSLVKGIDLGKTATSNPIYTQIQIIKDLKNNAVFLKRYDELNWVKIVY